MSAEQARPAVDSGGQGEWVLPSISYVEPARRHCALCGRPIARRYWRAAVAGETRNFCDPDHEALYRSYWIPTWGKR